MILARLLDPADFGLVGMVTAFTGVLNLFRDFGLSSAAVQRTNVTDEQFSTLFWINVLVGLVLGIVAVIMAPAMVSFYHEPRLFRVTLVLALGFLFNAAGVQHTALLQRQMRFTALAMINTIGLVAGTLVAIAGAKAGYGYWALVVMPVIYPLVTTVGLWISTGWIPGRPQRRSGIRSMMRFGGIVTANGITMYMASNFDKSLVGRYLGADVLGIYGRAYQLINIPSDNLNSVAGEVAFAALSRVKDDPISLRNYFLKGYSLVLAMTLPITLACAFFAEDVIRVLLGPKWMTAAPIFRYLAPTILAFAVLNPLGWLLNSLGLVVRGLKIALVLAPVMVAGYALGLRYGAAGVAISYSATMILSVLPLIAWAVHGTSISVRDIVKTIGQPLTSSFVGTVVALLARFTIGKFLAPLPLLVMESSILLIVFVLMLFYVMKQKTFYMNLIQGFRKQAPVEEQVLVSAAGS